MTSITFNKGLFIRTIVVFIILTTVWTALCIVTDEFTNNDKGFVTGVGFLVLLAASIFIGQKVKNWASLLALIIFMILTFLITSFVLGPLIGAVTNSTIVIVLASSLFVSFVTTMVLNKIIGIEFKIMTMSLTFLLLLFAYFIYYKLNNKLYFDYDFHPRLTMFNVFQLCLIIPLTLGMTLKKTNND